MIKNLDMTKIKYSAGKEEKPAEFSN